TAVPSCTSHARKTERRLLAGAKLLNCITPTPGASRARSSPVMRSGIPGSHLCSARLGLPGPWRASRAELCRVVARSLVVPRVARLARAPDQAVGERLPERGVRPEPEVRRDAVAVEVGEVHLRGRLMLHGGSRCQVGYDGYPLSN